MRKILIIKPDNIGDVVLFTGALPHLRRIFAGCHITLAVKKHIVNLVELSPHVDRVIDFETLRWEPALAKRFPRLKLVVRWAQRLCWTLTGRYERIIYPVRAPQHAHLRLIKELPPVSIYGMVGCPVNAPEGYPPELDPRHFFRATLDLTGYSPWRHERDITALFLQFLGGPQLEGERLEPQLFFAAQESSLLHRQPREGDILGIFPFATSPIRDWDMGNYPRVLEQLPRVKTVLLFGSSADEERAAELESELLKARPDLSVLNLAGASTLRQSCLTIADCSVLLCVESAGLHLGIAQGRPTVGIVGGGHYGRFVPWGDPQRTIFLTRRLDCFNCNWHCERAAAECIENVTPTEVAAAVTALLG